MIISASRRTDIPAFFTEWFERRLKEGFCLVRNPFNPSCIYRVSLKRQDVTGFVFWTRNPKPFMRILKLLDSEGFPYYFLFTLNNYPSLLEPGVPSPEDSLRSFKTLSERIGPHRVRWRYDPVIFSNITGLSFHKRNFENLCSELSGYTHHIITSYLTPYRKTLSNLRKLGKKGFVLQEDKEEELFSLLKFMGECAKDAGMKVYSCAEKKSRESPGIKKGACIDPVLFQSLGAEPSFKKDPGQRKECLCVVSKDIGATNTCLHACTYCYSTLNLKVARKNFKRHNPSSPLIV